MRSQPEEHGKNCVIKSKRYDVLGGPRVYFGILGVIFSNPASKGSKCDSILFPIIISILSGYQDLCYLSPPVRDKI